MSAYNGIGAKFDMNGGRNVALLQFLCTGDPPLVLDLCLDAESLSW